jgi:3-isopropylmalate dehydratase
LITKRSKNMRIQVDGELAPGVSSKDVILHVIGKIGTAGGTQSVIEFTGQLVSPYPLAVTLLTPFRLRHPHT